MSVHNKSCFPNFIFLNEKKNQKVSNDSWHYFENPKIFDDPLHNLGMSCKTNLTQFLLAIGGIIPLILYHVTTTGRYRVKDHILISGQSCR